MSDAIIVALIIFGFVTIMRNRGLGRSHRELRDSFDNLQNVPPPAALPGASRDQVERLEERVRVLERIVTEDRGTKQLSAEIERLRDN
ncbi:MAG: hypothetical protein ABIP41_05755 [Croceibacterium sp.]